MNNVRCSLIAAGLALPMVTGAQQPVVTTAGFTPAARVLFQTDFSADPLGSFPATLRHTRGPLEVVDVGGTRLLRSSGPSEFVIPLSTRLPQDFTLEFTLHPRVSRSYGGEELTFEGGAVKDESPGSAHVLWNQVLTRVVGGGADPFQVLLPEDLKGEFAGGQPVLIQAMVSGPSLKVFVNGRQMHNLPNVQFRRLPLLRVSLGGMNDGDGAVYLARLRVATNQGPPGTPTPTPPPGTPTTGNNPSGGNSASAGTASNQFAAGAPPPRTVTGLTVTQGTSGPVVTWQQFAGPATYSVRRWKANDPLCCNNMSPATPALTGSPWQDKPLPSLGTYIYEVTITTPSGTGSAQTQFVNIAAAGTGRGPRQVAPQPRTPSVTPPPGAVAGTLSSGFNVSVAAGAAGPVARWNAAPGQPATYTVRRWKVDDAACCNNQTPAGSSLTATSWQDAPLPMSGTYAYEVTAQTSLGAIVAQTMFGWRQPASGTTTPPLTPVLVQPGGTATPVQPPPLVRPPGSTSPTPMNTAAAPGSLQVYGTPVAANLMWSAVPGAVRYTIDRAITGQPAVTNLGSPLYQDGVNFRDFFPGPQSTYTYRVHAFQADGTYGTSSVNYTPPTPTDPMGFTAVQTAPGEVTFQLRSVRGVSEYLLAGPGAGTGIRVFGNSHGNLLSIHTLTGVPPGTHTWTIASNWTPGGVLTQAPNWPRATATVVASTAPRYRLVALGFKAVAQSKDIDDARDGHGDEVYFSAVVNQTTLTKLPLPVTHAGSVSLALTKAYGDQAVSVPYGRFKAGTASATGGIRTGDIVPASLDLDAPTGSVQRDQFPLLLWEGELENDAVVVVHPTLWEDDLDPQVYAWWTGTVFTEAQSGYTVNTVNGLSPADPYADQATGQRETGDEIYGVVNEIGAIYRGDRRIGCCGYRLGNWLIQCTTAPNFYRRPCEAHGVDRPIGLQWEASPKDWQEHLVVLTKANVNLVLARAGAPGASGTFTVKLADWQGPNIDEAIAHYELYLRVERVP